MEKPHEPTNAGLPGFRSREQLDAARKPPAARMVNTVSTIRPAAWIGAVVLLAAAANMLGWITGTRFLVQPVTGPAMVFNAALCFALLAAALVLDDPESPRRVRMQQMLGWSVMLFAGLVLSQRFFDTNTGVDLPALHLWITDDNRYPGRMSRLTCIAFMSGGAALALMHRVRSLWQGLLVQALTALPALLAVVAIAGLFLELRFVYRDFMFGQAAAASLSFIAVSAGLWQCWRGAAWYRARALLRNEDRRIGLIGAMTLAVVTACAVLAGFSTAQREIEAIISNSLLQTLGNNVKTFNLIIDHRIVRAQTLSSHTGVTRYLHDLKSRKNESDALDRLRLIAERFLPLGFSGVAFLDGDGSELLRIGEFANRPEWSSALDFPHSAQLLHWNGGLLLGTRMPVSSEGEVIGFVASEQTLTALTAALKDSNTFRETGETGICRVGDSMFHCLPQRFMPQTYRIPYSKTLPMSRATAGRTGVMRARDYRNQQVIAAHGPISSTGLGMVTKVDTTELYAPIREYLHNALLLSLLLGVGGGVFLYARLKPLVGEIERSREAVREQGERALRVSEDRYSGIINSAMDAIIAIDERRCVLLFNPAAARMFQYDAAKVIGRPLDMLLPLRFRAAHERHIREFAESGVTARSMGRPGAISGLRANGEEFPVEASISQTGTPPDKLFTVILRDVTERKRAEEAIKTSEVMLRNVIDGLGPYMFVGLMTPDGVIIEANQPALAAAGLKREDVIGESVEQTYWFAYSEAVQRQLRSTIKTAAAGTFCRYDMEIRINATELAWVDFSVHPMRDGSGRVIYLVPSAMVITERKQAEAAQRELSRRLLEVEEAERRAISRELHDRIGQDLSAINLTIDLMRMQQPDHAQQGQQYRLDDMQQLVRSSIDSARNIMADLHPAGLEDSGLAIALQYHAERISQRLQIPVTVNNNWRSTRPAPAVELALFRIAQEAINNIAKHAGATNIGIDLEEDTAATRLTLRIRDDGCGFDTSTARPRNHGLRTMRERAQAVGAILRVESAPGKGSSIIVELQGNTS